MNDYERVIQDTGLINLLADTCLIPVAGLDARSFLNGLLTNNIKTLQEGRGCYACICSPKGKILADLFCYSISGTFFIIECRKDLKNKILDLLRKYAVNQKITIGEESLHPEGGDLADWGGVGILGAQAHSWFQKYYPDCLLATDLSHKTEEPKSIWIIRKNVWGYPCYEIWSDFTLEWDGKGTELISKATQEVLRIESKTPLYGVDMNENTIPQEANLFHALNFQKGCYIGQETIARLQNLGHVNKHLVLLKIEDGHPEQSETSLPKGTIIHTLAGEETGEITSSCYSPKYQSVIALGYIRYAHFGEKEFKIGNNLAKIL